jgi:hypothetical protein
MLLTPISRKKTPAREGLCRTASGRWRKGTTTRREAGLGKKAVKKCTFRQRSSWKNYANAAISTKPNNCTSTSEGKITTTRLLCAHLFPPARASSMMPARLRLSRTMGQRLHEQRGRPQCGTYGEVRHLARPVGDHTISWGWMVKWVDGEVCERLMIVRVVEVP